MLARRLVLVVVTAFLLGSCYSSSDEAHDELPEGSPTFARGNAVIETDEGSVLVRAEVAETPEQHQFGLMHRTSLPEDGGMVFVFFEEQTGGFWMKNTLIPLSIAFFDVNGNIVRILDMEPCRKDPCPTYEPGAPYMGALEVNQGAFEEWGVEEGDEINLSR